jgi:hypothetical protein
MFAKEYGDNKTYSSNRKTMETMETQQIFNTSVSDMILTIGGQILFLLVIGLVVYFAGSTSSPVASIIQKTMKTNSRS